MLKIKNNTLEDFKKLHKKYLLPCNGYVFKKCIDISPKTKDMSRKWLVILQKTTNTKTNESREVTDYRYAKYRGSEFLVKKIININNPKLIKKKIVNKIYGKELEYKVGEIVKVDNYDEDLKRVCSSGIHYFKNIEPAYFYYTTPKNFTGSHRKWHDDGKKMIVCNYVNGTKNGEYKKWHNNGQIQREYEYVDNKINGKYVEWYDNGQKYIECKCINNEKNGKYRSWYKNGKMNEECEYIDNKLNGKYRSWRDNGHKHIECVYVDNKINGMYHEWNSNGKKAGEYEYRNGIII